MSEDSIEELSFFRVFAWPVPESFASAIASSRFELGDVLYRDAQAYRVWSGETAPAFTAIQVLDPPRSTRSGLTEGDVDRRSANWQSEVRIALVDPAAGTSVERLLTQGNLLMALWTGDEGWLDPNRPQSEFPRTARDLYAQIDRSEPAWADVIGASRPRSGILFVMVVDLASDASRAKAASVDEALRGTGIVRIEDRTPGEAGLETSDIFHPTLVLRGFLMPGRDTDSVEAALRTCLYRGGQATSESPAATSGEDVPVARDRFSVARHGLLVSY